MDVRDHQAAAHGFLHQGQHPTLGRRFAECGYRPMIELLRYLEASDEQGGAIVCLAEPDVLDDPADDDQR